MPPPTPLQPNTTVIDLRPGAEPLPFPAVKLTLEAIEEGQYGLSDQGFYLVVCDRGTRAVLAARYLRADGLKAQAWQGTLEDLEEALGRVAEE